MPSVSAGDLDVAYEMFGPLDAPRVLVIGGTGQTLAGSFNTNHALNASFRTLHYDQRDLGATRGPVRETTMADYADDAARLLTALGWDRAHVVGTSFGGMVAQNVAVRHPERVERLVLLCTSPGGPLPSAPLHELEDLPAEERAERHLALLDTRYDPKADEPLPGLGALLPGLRARWTSDADPETRAGQRRQLEARAGHDVLDALATITAPTLVCAGRFDGIAPLANSEAIAERIPGARLELFDGGHVFMWQDTRVWPTVIDFLDAP